MFEFQIGGYVIIILMVLISISILYFIIRRIKDKALRVEIRNYEKIGFIEIILGFIFTLASIFLYISIQKDIDNTIPILRPISVVTSESIKLLLIALFLVGVSIIINGIYTLLDKIQMEKF